MNIKEWVSNLNRIQKFFLLGICALPFLMENFDSFDSHRGSGDTAIIIIAIKNFLSVGATHAAT